MAKQLYVRESREIRFENADEGLREALRAYIERELPGDSPLKTVKACLETRSERRKGFFDKLLGRDTRQLGIAVITARWLFTVVTDPKSGAGLAVGHKLDGLDVLDYARSDWARLAPDTGLRLTGFGPGATERRSYFFGMGPGEAAERFRAQLDKAVEKAS